MQKVMQAKMCRNVLLVPSCLWHTPLWHPCVACHSGFINSLLQYAYMQGHTRLVLFCPGVGAEPGLGTI